jgi:hypothetical protein
MPGFDNMSVNIPLVKSTYKKIMALGEGAKGDDFVMVINEYPNLRYLVQSTQLPALKREAVNIKGPHGIEINQQGRFMNAQDITITFKEVISGEAYKALKDWVVNKRYLTVAIALISESKPDEDLSTAVALEDAWIELDAVDLSVDDGATLVKPSGTIHANWVNYPDTLE